jgi:hypothetical protein
MYQRFHSAGPLVQAQADEAHGQHDHHGLDQHLDELADRIGHRLGLVLHLHQLTPAGRRFDAVAAAAPCPADDVAALGHGHAQRDHLLPWWRTLTWADRHSRGDLGDVAQAQLAPERRGWAWRAAAPRP